MKSKLYYVLYFLYAVVVAFVLYLNGVFTGEWSSYTNLIINIVFLIIIGILFIISSVSFGRLNRVTYELEEVAFRMQKEYCLLYTSGEITKIITGFLRKRNCRQRLISTVCA